MRLALILTFSMFGTAGAAHPGHLADLAGHDHWVAGAAIGLIILTGLYGALKGGKDEDPSEDATPEEEAA